MSLETDVGAQRRANMTESQIRMWAGQKLSGRRPVYNMAIALDIYGPLNIATFRGAHDLVIRGSDILRSAFPFVDGGPKREILARGDFDYEIAYLDFSDNPAGIEAWMDDRIKARPNLKEVLFNSALLKVGAEHHVWYIGQHHLICDGRSLANFVEWVGDTYAAIEAGERNPAVPEVPEFSDFVAREIAYTSTSAFEKSGRYWAEKPTPPLPDLALYGRGADQGSNECLRVHRPLRPALTESMAALIANKTFRAFSADQGMYLLYTTALAVQLKKASGNDSLSLGVFLHHRLTAADRDRALGPFMNFSQIRVNFEADDTFKTLYARISAEYRSLLRHYRHPHPVPAGERAYDVAINLVNTTYPEFAGRRTHVTWLQSGAWFAHEPLSIQIHSFSEGDGVTVEWDFNKGTFNNDELRQQAMSDFEWALQIAIDAPDARLLDVLDGSFRSESAA